MLLLLALSLISAGIQAQSHQPAPEGLVKELRMSLESGDLGKAGEVATQLEESLRWKAEGARVAAMRSKVDRILSWLPGDIESIYVYQTAFEATAKDQQGRMYGMPEKQCAVSHLLKLDEGNFYKGLAGRQISAVVAAMRNNYEAVDEADGAPDPIPRGEYAYVLLLATEFEQKQLGEPEYGSDGKPFWKTTNKWQVFRRGAKVFLQEENLLTLIAPDVLFVSTSPSLFKEILSRSQNREQSVAIFQTGPQWKVVNRAATAWGIRQYSTPATRRDSTNPHLPLEGRPARDPEAIGVAMHFDALSQQVEIAYWGELKALEYYSAVEREFRVRQDGASLRLSGSLKERGDSPFYFATTILGFGSCL